MDRSGKARDGGKRRVRRWDGNLPLRGFRNKGEMEMKYLIKEQECGYLMKNGRFVRLLTAGKYRFMKELGYEVQVVPMTGQVKTCGIPEEILMGDREFTACCI